MQADAVRRNITPSPASRGIIVYRHTAAYKFLNLNSEGKKEGRKNDYAKVFAYHDIQLE